MYKLLAITMLLIQLARIYGQIDVGVNVDVKSSKGIQQGWEGCPEEVPCPPAQAQRIVGGCQVKPHDIPWQLRLGWMGGDCGASIICPKYIITAAHCHTIQKTETGCSRIGEPEEIRITVGSHDDFGTDGEAHSVKKIFTNEEWCCKGSTCPAPDYSDISIMELTQEIRLGLPSNKPKAMALTLNPVAQEMIPSNTVFAISGWGSNDENGQGNYCPTEKLNGARVDFVSLAECKRLRAGSTPFSGNFNGLVCAWDPKTKTACNGDSGGPLAWLDGQQVKLVGVASFASRGNGTSLGGQRDNNCLRLPTVYVDVAFHLDWINKITGGCNSKTCRDDSKCSTKSNLDDAVREQFFEP